MPEEISWATRNELMNSQYKIQSAMVGARPPAQPVVENTAPDGESFDPPHYEETVKPVEPKLRGTLADSIAKQKTVEQTALDPDMYKQNKGPSRI
jgi:hypothetical protein